MVAAIELRGISKQYRERNGEGVIALSPTDLNIEPGEFFTLLGPSGCGKSTTLRLIAGFETPTEGKLLIHGQPMNDIPPHRRPVNMVFQDYALFPHMTVYDNVEFGLSVKKVPRPERQRRVHEALAMVQLAGYERRRPNQLSGGQKQRVALARALVNQPAVLLLDEPLGALDLKLRRAMQIELKHLQQQVGITFIYVTHDQEEALAMSDRIAVMNEGHVLQVGTPKAIYEHPATRFVADFVGETNFLQGMVQLIEPDHIRVEIGGKQLDVAHSTNGIRTGQSVTVAIRPEKLSLQEARPEGESLYGTIEEIVFLGTDTRYVVRLDSGEKLVIRVQNHEIGIEPVFGVDTKVTVQCQPSHAQILTG